LTSPTTGWVNSLRAEVGQTVSVGQTLCEIRTTEDDVSSEELVEMPHVSTSEDAQVSGPDMMHDEPNPEVAKAENMSEEMEKHAEAEPVPVSNVETRADTDDNIQTNLNETIHEPALDESLFAARDSAMDAGGGAKFSGEGSVLPSTPSTSTSTSHEPVPERRQAEAGSEGDKISVKASPAVRTLATRLGLELSELTGTGEDGRVTKEDVHAAAGEVPAPKKSTLGATVDAEREKQEEVTRVDFGRTRKAMWRRMSAVGEVPHFG